MNRTKDAQQLTQSLSLRTLDLGVLYVTGADELLKEVTVAAQDYQ